MPTIDSLTDVLVSEIRDLYDADKRLTTARAARKEGHRWGAQNRIDRSLARNQRLGPAARTGVSRPRVEATREAVRRRKPWAELFDPARRRSITLWDHVKENADYPYYLIRDCFAGAESRSLRSVKRGHGLIIERDGAKVAAYRNDNGAMTLRSATCTHMGCIRPVESRRTHLGLRATARASSPGAMCLPGPAEAPLSPVD
jgi:Rieske Fe-S protein